MSHDEDPAAAVCHGQENSGLFGFRQNRQLAAGVNVRRGDFRMSGVRRQEHIVESSHQRDLAVHHLMPEKTEHFLIQRFLLKPVEMIQGRLGGPAEKDRRGHMRICPVHDLRQLLPVIHFLEFHLFHRGAGNDHTVKLHIFQFRKSLVKLIQMTERGVFCLMAFHRHESHIHLKRRVGQRSQKLKFRFLFQRHQIQDQDLDRADILMDRPFFIHHKNIFSFQYFFYRKVTLYLNRHFLSPPFSCCHTGLFPGLRKPCILIRFLLDPCPRVSEILPRK